MGLSRRKFTREMKLAAVERLKMGASIAEVARAFEVNANLLHRWRKEFRDGPGNAFPGVRKRRWDESRVAQLERKIGLFATILSLSVVWNNYPRFKSFLMPSLPQSLGRRRIPSTRSTISPDTSRKFRLFSKGFNAFRAPLSIATCNGSARDRIGLILP